MIVDFYKFQGTGNDFIMIDDREREFDMNDSLLIKSLCERRFGIGSDGLILLQNHEEYDFEMVFFNSTGERSTFCGNGGRCVLAFANMLGIFENESKFIAYDGLHEGSVKENMVSLKMSDVNEVTVREDSVVLDTGSPHLVKLVESVEKVNVLNKGRKLRFSKEFGDYGINVNFAEVNDCVSIRTYERGDEMESLSCGTGSVATAIALYEIGKWKETDVVINTTGGELNVSFNHDGSKYTDIWLSGESSMVYAGEFEC
ncbi:MAG: diaminopimelate epimerase [Flavobacteriales bacterium]|jgi:diaminopimelate epimerase|nr:diaminopimelate epimerase [Flavobacteriales bacterium]